MQAGVKLSQSKIDQILLDYKAGMRVYDIASKHNVNKESITKYARLAGITRKKWTEAFTNKLKAEYEAGETLTCLAAKYNVCRVDLGKRLKAQGVTVLHDSLRKQLVKHNPFEDLNNPNVQYWLGWLASDGCVTDRHAIILTICKDPHMLELYKDFVGENLKVYCQDQKNSLNKKYFTEFYNLEVANHLIDLGITPRKSLTLEINFDFTWDFVRGYLDGNGSCKNGARTSTLVWYTASKKFYSQLKDFFLKEGLNASYQERISGTSSTLYAINLNRVNEDLISKLYPTKCVYLERKRPLNVISN